MIKKSILLASLCMLPILVFATEAVSPYAGQQNRIIKALSKNEINGLLTGKGLGLAKAGELNNYPGPKHVLELADKLEISTRQVQQTKDIFNQMKKQAVPLGKQIVEKERQLENLFSTRQVNKENLEKVLQEIGSLRAQLRYVHLYAHLQQKKVLTDLQVMHYTKLRGYTGGKGHDGHGKHHHEQH